MPQGFANWNSHPFAYTTVKRLRDPVLGNLPESFLPDARARHLICFCSQWINTLTDQWFMPVRLRHKVHGRHSSMIHLPNQVPILELLTLEIGRDELGFIEFPTVSYQVLPRQVMMVGRRTNLTDIPHFAILNGVFGWLDQDFVELEETTVSAKSLKGADSIALLACKDLEAGDVLLIGDDPNTAFSFILDAVEASPPRVFGEPLPRIVEIGEKVRRYGTIPKMIEYALMLMVRDRACTIGDIDIDEQQFGIGTRLNSESVEGYSYNLSPLPAVVGFGGGARTTGNPEADDILSMFMFHKPPYIGGRTCFRRPFLFGREKYITMTSASSLPESFWAARRWCPPTI